MNKEYIETLKKAYEVYNINKGLKLHLEILSYIRERIIANKKEIESLIELFGEKISYKDILKTYDAEMAKKAEYKSQFNMKKREDGFVSALYTTSVGMILVESSEVLSVLKYYIIAIKSRNVVVIADKNYQENDLKQFLLMIVKEALNKFEIDNRLIEIWPYEECVDKYFDVLVYDNKEIKKREEEEKMYIYLENDFFKDIVNIEVGKLKKDGKNIEVLTGDIKSAINVINKKINKGACIYTKDTKKGYQFINLVHSKNAFVNVTLQNVKNIENNKDVFYMNKNIMYELKSVLMK